MNAGAAVGVVELECEFGRFFRRWKHLVRYEFDQFCAINREWTTLFWETKKLCFVLTARAIAASLQLIDYFFSCIICVIFRFILFYLLIHIFRVFTFVCFCFCNFFLFSIVFVYFFWTNNSRECDHIKLVLIDPYFYLVLIFSFLFQFHFLNRITSFERLLGEGWFVLNI